jgi:mannitol-specific phosphotransferase system IIBC component
MRIQNALVLLVLALVGAFTALNWGAILATTSLSLGIATIQAPLGLIMLGLLGLLVAVIAAFVVYVLYLQSTVLWDARRNARELQANRELADKAEASRFTELRTHLDATFKQQAQQDQSGQQSLLNRIDALEAALSLVVEQSGNSLSAAVGELEDRLLSTGRQPEGRG